MPPGPAHRRNRHAADRNRCCAISLMQSATRSYSKPGHERKCEQRFTLATIFAAQSACAVVEKNTPINSSIRAPSHPRGDKKQDLPISIHCQSLSDRSVCTFVHIRGSTVPVEIRAWQSVPRQLDLPNLRRCSFAFSRMKIPICRRIEISCASGRFQRVFNHQENLVNLNGTYLSQDGNFSLTITNSNENGTFEGTYRHMNKVSDHALQRISAYLVHAPSSRRADRKPVR